MISFYGLLVQRNMQMLQWIQQIQKKKVFQECFVIHVRLMMGTLLKTFQIQKGILKMLLQSMQRKWIFQGFMIQNSFNSFKLQPDNGFLIKNYFFDKNDKELFKLTEFLKWLHQEDDFRPVKDKYIQYQQQEYKMIKTNLTGRTSGRSTCTRMFRSLTDRDQQYNKSKQKETNQTQVNIVLNEKNSSWKQFPTIDSADLQEVSEEGFTNNVYFDIQRCIKK